MQEKRKDSTLCPDDVILSVFLPKKPFTTLAVSLHTEK